MGLRVVVSRQRDRSSSFSNLFSLKSYETCNRTSLVFALVLKSDSTGMPGVLMTFSPSL